MSGTNPGAWPDQGEDEIIVDPIILRARKDAKLFTAADLKAARLETVERCISIAADTSLIASELDEIIERLEKLKEEIEHE